MLIIVKIVTGLGPVLISLNLHCTQLYNRMDCVLKHDFLLTRREVVRSLDLLLVEVNLVLPTQDEGMQSAFPRSIAKAR